MNISDPEEPEPEGHEHVCLRSVCCVECDIEGCTEDENGPNLCLMTRSGTTECPELCAGCVALNLLEDEGFE